MARIRTIKPEFWADQKIAQELSRECRLFYIALWNECDDVGRFRAYPRRLLGVLFPYDEDLTEGDVRSWLQRLTETGRMIRYDVDGEAFGQLTHWSHQKIERPSQRVLPPPPEPSPSPHRALTEGSPSVVVVVPGPGPWTGDHGSGPGSGDLRAPAQEASPGNPENGNLEGDPLTPWLGEHAVVLADCPPAASDRARRTLYSHYGPPGMRAGAWSRDDGSTVPTADRPRLLALALSGYAAEENRTIRTNEFAGMVHKIANEARENGRGPPEAPLTTAQHRRYLEIRGELEDGGMEAEAAAPIAAERARREAG